MKDVSTNDRAKLAARIQLATMDMTRAIGRLEKLAAAVMTGLDETTMLARISAAYASVSALDMHGQFAVLGILDDIDEAFGLNDADADADDDSGAPAAPALAS